MKFLKMKKIFLFVSFLHLSLCRVWAYGNGDFMRETGKIYVTAGVLLLIFAGIVLYLIRLDRRITRLEHHTKDSTHE
jgi:hypothetical protein